ncbi:hypothetical protein EV401DRAFT_159249 [Pisolithus croceorrhizus]|nr:hypothetical protein EV401DRAFT_159249 [Pisolithus croceorrhizus]
MPVARRPLSGVARSLQLALPQISASFPYLWLRDACQCPKCVHPSTLQRLHRLADIPADICPATDGVDLKQDGVHIRWADGHEWFHSFTFLERYSSASSLFSFHRDVPSESWNASTITQSPDLFVPYDDLSKPSRLLGAMTQLTRFGLLFLTGVPTDNAEGATCETRRLATLFGEIRPTFYGELWDVKNIAGSRNIAYTNLDLGLHCDLQYFEHPPRYQILHCIRNRVIGGKSVFADGLHVANTIRRTRPEDFSILSTTRVPFHYINDGHHLHHEHPTIDLERIPTLSSAEPTVKYINYSPPFQAPLLLSPTLLELHTALKHFAALLDVPDNRVEHVLREGDAVLFDNRRVLHARTAFTDTGHGVDGEANRWLRGCYVEMDSLLDCGRVLRANIEKGKPGSVNYNI